MTFFRNAALSFLFLISLASAASAAPETFMAPEGQISSLMIFEQSGFARIYGIFLRGLARFQYDDQLKTLDDLKLSLLANSFTSVSPVLKQEFGRGNLENDKENEVAFVQSEPARFENGKARIKGQLIINNIRKDAVMEAELNRFGRISQTTDVMEEGKQTVGLSMHISIKRSDYSMSAEGASSPFNDDATLLLDLVGQK